jgi:hypothetical protein
MGINTIAIFLSKKACLILSVFCEYNFMNEFIYLASLNNRNINLQIIKSFSVLILNTSNTTTLYYIFSNNFINQIISNDYEKYDDDFISYYVNFIKSLSLKIDQMTIQFFFHKQFNSFPLLQSALKMYNHSDAMIKNVVRNIVLTVLKSKHYITILVKYEPIMDYFSSLPAITYFPFLACRLRDLIIKLNDEIISDDQISLKSIHDDIIDDILYFQDIYSLKLDRINYILTNTLFYYIVLPLLCGSLVSMVKPKVAISISLYVILSLCHYIKDEAFLNSLFIIILNPKLNANVKKMIEDYPRDIKNYKFDWASQKKIVAGSFTNFISSNFSEPFLRGLLFQVNSTYPEIIAINKKYEKVQEDISSPSFFAGLLEDILSKFSNSEIDIMTTYHNSLSKATGINVGISTDDMKKECIISVVSDILQQTKENPDTLANNECRDNILTYLKSKDDTLILLVSLLINTIHKKNIAKQLLINSKLIPADSLSSEYDTNKILDELFSSTLKPDANEEKQDIGDFFVSNTNGIGVGDFKTIDTLLETIEMENSIAKTNVVVDTEINTEGNSLHINIEKIELIVPSEHVDSTVIYNEISIDNRYVSKTLGNETVQSTYDHEIVDSLLNVRFI